MFSMWCVPGKSKFHELVLESIRAHGTVDVPLPPAPPPFRFSEPATCIAELLTAGFDKPVVAELPLAFCPSSATDVLELTRSAVRLEMMIELQTIRAESAFAKPLWKGRRNSALARYSKFQCRR